MTTARQTAAPPEKRGSAGIVIATAGIVLAIAALAILVAQNTDQVDIGFLGWEFAFPLSVGLLVAAVGGAVLAFGISVLIVVRRRSRR
ncbi:lipopolysaccharide assembly protein LapA domain-containing protein [Corynebacterium neomassiliense]|uniref:lipopolysaccharide assembly protein LapA domain-containing protein n=1 Tax=Corynebacterium neomassiliense TaxID=2079482 RepID=UPI001030EF62|nr:LapA family protein [Corynebacterium neomassiliense]